MRVCSVPCDDHVVPLVIVQWVVAVPFQQTGPVPEVKHVVDKPGEQIRPGVSRLTNTVEVRNRLNQYQHGYLKCIHSATNMSICIWSSSPFDQLHCDEVVPVSTVEHDETIGRGGFELEEQVHRGVSLQSGQSQVAALSLEGDGVGDNESHAKAGVELAEVDVPILAHVDVLHTIKSEALKRLKKEKRQR